MRIVVDLPSNIVLSLAEEIERGRWASVDEAVSIILGKSLTPKRAVTEQVPADGRSAMWTKPNHTRSATGASVVDRDESAPWLWGMVNRVFPLKFVVRVCANLCADGPVDLYRLNSVVADSALALTPILLSKDAAENRKRNEGRIVGFPNGKDIRKSKVRFALQFCGRLSESSQFLGGAFETGLLGPVGDEGLVAPTPIGWLFARIPSSVLDSQGGNSNLSDEECDFYVEEIVPSVPAEKAAFLGLLEALQMEPLSPEALVRTTKPRVKPGSSTVVADTARSGALGRALDVGTVKRRPIGRSAMLSITPRGVKTLILLGGKN